MELNSGLIYIDEATVRVSSGANNGKNSRQLCNAWCPTSKESRRMVGVLRGRNLYVPVPWVVEASDI